MDVTRAAGERYREVWARAARLGAPTAGQSAARQAMQTIDVLVAAALSPASVVAIGIADLYVSLPFRVSGGLVTASRTLASQDTGAGAGTNRDQATTQAAVLAGLVALPFALAGFLAGPGILSLVGTDAGTARLGGLYLALVTPTIPLGAVQAVAASALRGTGDTRTPMAVTVPADALNAAGSVVFGLGLFGAPRLGVVGIGAATLVSTTLAALVLLGYVHRRSPVSFVRPRDPTVARQLVRIALPKSGAGAATAVAVFPFNTLLLGFGTAVNAGYQLAWRVYAQVISPIGAGVGTATGVVVGQRLGEGDAGRVRTAARGMLAFGAGTALLLGVAVAAAAEPLARLLADDPSVAPVAAAFILTLGPVAVVGITNVTTSAVVEAGSETRVPLLSRVVGMFGGMVGVSWLLGVGLGWGVTGAYVGIVACYVLMLAISAWGYARTDWAGRAADMMVERGSVAAKD